MVQSETGGALVAYIDGGARGNPGPAGFGVRVERTDGTLVEEFHESIGTATNNVAEYRGLLAALEWARSHGHHTLHVRSDSLLLVQQMLGNYKVKNEGLQPLHAKARSLAGEIGRVTYEHVRRESNAHADRLANAAMDGAAGATVPANPPELPANAVSDTSDSTPFPALAAALRTVVSNAVPRMRAISESEAERPLAEGKWCRKDILGHLVDSAANNHQRFVRAQDGSLLSFPGYEQAFWVRTQRYREREWKDLLAFWEGYNRHLAHVIERIPEHKRNVECVIGTNEPVTLGFLVHDYIEHLRHHIAQF